MPKELEATAAEPYLQRYGPKNMVRLLVYLQGCCQM